MGKQNPREQINKAAWNFSESIKDTLRQNLMSAVSSKQLDIPRESLEKLLHVMGASVDEGYHRAAKSFSKSVDQIVSDVELPSLGVPSPKKNRVLETR